VPQAAGIVQHSGQPFCAVRSLCVFCGSSAGRDPRFPGLARDFGRLLTESGLTLVYGGGHVGLMGSLADAVLAAGGHVIGVIPRLLVEREVGHSGLPDLRIVGSMAERKTLMMELADAFVALPGGIGTMDELFEAWSWTQLSLHRKPCGLLNAFGFYDALIAFLDRSTDDGFLHPQTRATLLVESEPRCLLDRLARWGPSESG